MACNEATSGGQRRTVRPIASGTYDKASGLLALVVSDTELTGLDLAHAMWTVSYRPGDFGLGIINKPEAASGGPDAVVSIQINASGPAPDIKIYSDTTRWWLEITSSDSHPVSRTFAPRKVSYSPGLKVFTLEVPVDLLGGISVTGASWNAVFIAPSGNALPPQRLTRRVPAGSHRPRRKTTPISISPGAIWPGSGRSRLFPSMRRRVTRIRSAACRF